MNNLKAHEVVSWKIIVKEIKRKKISTGTVNAYEKKLKITNNVCHSPRGAIKHEENLLAKSSTMRLQIHICYLSQPCY